VSWPSFFLGGPGQYFVAGGVGVFESADDVSFATVAEVLEAGVFESPEREHCFVHDGGVEHTEVAELLEVFYF
jgi:hypothetical protein